MWKDVPERRNTDMEIGKKLKDARMKSGFTQEAVAEKINMSRQTISNWENEKSYQDIISVIELSSLYSISLDDLLKGDERMMEHLEESTNVVKSNQKLIGAIILNIITVILLITLSMFLPDKNYYLIMVFCLAIVSSAVLLYQIIRRIKGRNYNGQKYCIGCDIWCGRSCRSYGNGISDLSVNGDGCSRPWIKTSKIMGTACCERE